MKFNCKVCDKEFNRKPSEVAKGHNIYCSRNCRHIDMRKGQYINCATCGKRVYKKRRDIEKWGKSFCSRKCYRPIIETRSCPTCKRMFTPAQNSTMYCSLKCAGRKNNPEQVRICDYCKVEFTRAPSRLDRQGKGRNFCSIDCFYNWNCQENHSHWKGGHSCYRGPNWQKQRKKARKRDSYICQSCNITEKEIGQELDVHHIRPYRLFESYKTANNLKNLICYCHKCHLRIEKQTA